MSSKDYMEFIQGLKLFRVLKWKQSSKEGAYEDDREIADISEADVVTSLVEDTPSSMFMGKRHKLVLDIDMDAELVPSSTEGHFHLYIDHMMSESQYFKLLEALVEAGIVEDGYVKAAIRRGFTCVRLPWIRKEISNVPE